MPTNNFLAFATGGGAVVMPQSDYAAVAATGVAAGIADPTFANKAWRQSAFMSAALGQLITTAGGVDALDNGNLSNLVAGLTAAFAAVVPLSTYAIVTGADNSMVATVSGVTSLTANPLYLVARFPTVNTVDGPKLNLNGLGAKTIYQKDFTTALPAGQLPLEGLITFRTTLDGWVLQTEPAGGGYGIDTATGANSLSAQMPGIRAYFEGLQVTVKNKITNTGAATLNIPTLGAKAITYQGSALTAGQLVGGRIYNFVYTAAGAWQLISPPG